MSKSYGNTVELFATDKDVEKSIKRIVTDSRGVDDPKDPATCNVFQILRLFVDDAERTEIEARYRAGGTGYGPFKQRLVEKFHEHFDAARARRRELEKDLGYVREVLRAGAEKARAAAAVTLRDVQEACGIRW